MIFVTYKTHRYDKDWLQATFTRDKQFVDWYIANQVGIDVMAVERYGVDYD